MSTSIHAEQCSGGADMLRGEGRRRGVYASRWRGYGGGVSGMALGQETKLLNLYLDTNVWG